MDNSTIRNGFATIALVAVAACSTTAGGYTPAPTAAGPQTIHAAPQSMHQPAQPPSQTQRSLAGAALSVAGSTVNLNEFGSSDSRTVQMLRHGRTISHKRTPHTTAPNCNRGVEYSYSSTGFGQVTESLEYFYDSLCTMPAELYTLNANYTSAGGTAESTETTWDRSANITGYQMFSISFATGGDGGLTNIVVQKTNNQGANLYSSGFTCLFQTGNAVDCGSGVISTVGSNSDARMHPNTVATPTPTATPSAPPTPGEVGFAQTALGQYVTSSSSRRANDHGWGGSASQLQLQINGAGFAGPAGSLSILAETPPAWLISGGTQVDTLTGTATIGFGGYQHGHDGWSAGRSRNSSDFWPGAMSSLALTLVDSANGLTVSLTSNGRGQLTGSVTQTATGQPVATMTLDFTGTGYISYTGGAVDHVQDWVIID
jgi:hypothetical protein